MIKREFKHSQNYRRNRVKRYGKRANFRNYTNISERPKYRKTLSERRTSKRTEYQNKYINLFALKSAISFICVFSIFIAVNFNIGLTPDIKYNIKNLLSENISYQKIENIIVKNFNNETKKDKYSNSHYDFRIDENIIEQMNSEK